MKKITNILELKKGDKIWRIKNNISVEIIEFLCIHPYNNNYSIFLDCNKDGMPKFYNKNLENSDYYLYDKDSREDMQSERVKKLELWLKNLKRKYYKYKTIDDYNDYNTGLTEIFNGWLDGTI